MSFDELVGKLRSRFGLRVVTNGSLPSYGLDGVKTTKVWLNCTPMLSLACPQSAHSELGQIIARDHFIPALRDREMKLKIRDRDPIDLDEAYKVAII